MAGRPPSLGDLPGDTRPRRTDRTDSDSMAPEHRLPKHLSGSDPNALASSSRINGKSTEHGNGSGHDTHPQSTSGSVSASASAAAAAAAAVVDPDTCRICRGEGTSDEPLFYPCKCSGSIKYVHQDCLMEWLSHSQKKHCELCKTPFRFTKLYSPNMPQHLPLHIFVSHMTKYLFRNFLVWLRAALVISVWLGWLPYLMRSVWSFLFWLSEESFGTGPNSNAASRGAGTYTLSVTGGSSTCPSTPFLASTTTSASLGGTMDLPHLNGIMKTITKPLNVSALESWVGALLRLSLNSITITGNETQNDSNGLNLTHVDKVTVSGASNPHGSLLSEVAVLKNLTRHSAINRTIIAVLEGQIITVVVIVAFILIILVRDYVVQQQPEINMRAAFAADGDRQNMGPIAGPDDVELRGPDSDDNDDDDDDNENNINADNEPADEEGSANSSDGESSTARGRLERIPDERDRRLAAVEQRQRPIAGFRRRAVRHNTPERRPSDPPQYNPSQPASQPEAGTARQQISESSDQREPPVSGELGDDYVAALAGAMKAAPADGTSAVTQYMRIYREAEGDRDTILQMIRDQGLDDRLRDWVRITLSMPVHPRQAAESSSTQGSSAPSSNDWRPDRLQPPQASQAHGILAEDNSSASSWATTEADDADDGSPSAVAKGKQKAEPNVGVDVTSKRGDVPWPGSEGQFQNMPWQLSNARDDISDEDDLTAPLGRPRAVSDGPQRSEAINPLANNSWSFSKLPPTPVSQADEPASRDSTDRGGFTSNTLRNEPFSFNPPLTTVNQPQTTSAFRHDVTGDASSNHNVRRINHELETTSESRSGVGQDGELENETGPHHSAGSDHGDNESTIVHTDAPVEVDHVGPPARPQAIGLVDRMADFMWGDVNADQLGDDLDEEPVDIFGDNQDAPFMDVGIDEEDNAADVEVNPEVVEAAMAAGLDPEAIEDAEDFEGIMELIGMRGPLAGLFQNAIFCAFLVSFTIFLGVYLPYNIGRISVWVVANPARFVRIIFSSFKFAQDLVLLAIGCVSTSVLDFFEVTGRTLRISLGSRLLLTTRDVTGHIASAALARISDSFKSELPLISGSEMRNFSAISHEALVFFKGDIGYLFSSIEGVLNFIFGGDYGNKFTASRDFLTAAWPAAWEFVKSIPHALIHPGSWTFSVALPEPSYTVNPGLLYWNATDRAWAVLGGYVTLFFGAALYLGRGRPLSTTPTAQEWEASVIDALNQASGVMKVVIIISIEMLVFPLYCGLLLDFALLPLFENTSLKSRLFFTYNFPATSIFVHWFVGTGYMFHFALFVSMCRKIMRKGVLYFIRDPDDPEFHPVRDVLERNVTTQLRKIMFSGLIYGALVVVCLGGVVWGLALALPNVLPIHYSSNEPVLEFPIDLLFYNFLMPLAVKFFRPSDGLHSMYTWWFRKCARVLRLTWFLFGERMVDEEGRLALAPNSEHKALPWWRTLFLEVGDDGLVVPKTWHDTFDDGDARPRVHISTDEMATLNEMKERLVESEQLIEDGRFVRSPASDQVKIPKGQSVFLNVTEQDVRVDGSEDGDVYASDKYQFVYVPPWFKVRVFLFIASIWLFAAVTGVGFTIIPLVFGRHMFRSLLPEHIRTNDIYAFSIGVYILGSFSYFLFHLRSILTGASARISSIVSLMLGQDAVQRAKLLIKQIARLTYTYSFLLVVFPILTTLLMELYVLVPLHTYRYSLASFMAPSPSPPEDFAPSARLDGLRDGHTIRVIQAWTLGILYLKLSTRALVHRGGRPAQAVRAVLRGGWAHPDVRVLTRAFIIPGVAAGLVLILAPPLMAKVVLDNGLLNAFVGPGTAAALRTREAEVIVFRMAYPFAALLLASSLVARRVLRIFDGWKIRIRDEAYLIGERLHNFGGVVKGAAGGGWRGSRRI